MNKKENKIKGCLWGGILGDCIGAAYEGRDSVDVITMDQPLLMTDDSQFTLATCEALEKNGKIRPEKVAECFRVWFEQRRIRGIGSSTLKAMRDLSAGQHWALAGATGEYAAGNGAAMRIAPLAFILNPFDASDRVLVKDICRITHNNDEAYLGALAILIAIYKNWQDPDYDQKLIISDIISELPDCRVRDQLMDLEKEPDGLTLKECAEKYGNSGYVVESAPFAICASTKLGQYGYQQLIEEVIKCGGDADTAASMTGQIIGCKVGYEALPLELIEKVEEKQMIEEIIEEFLKGL
ncbi:MAG: ADP-ribosylglycohydrolase family protein [Candidatus Omnitrophica bacterium]|nr:ADP-ribosylglycohydrolase family protein [Candidatus Omnitrophota bacterium]MCB9747927.1 ADP-ribosylglycohydrolase family protein [Candidatus Omnitrophota bacterium]